MDKMISLIICVYNEQDNIDPLAEEIKAALSSVDYEVLFVDDGSTDDTVTKIEHLTDSHFKLIRLRRNYGQSTALQAGIDYAKGDYIVTMDGDLQNNPNDILKMVELLKLKKCDVVAGIRANRHDGWFFRKVPSALANSIIRKLLKIKIKDFGCTLKVFRKEMAKELRIYGEMHRFIPVLVAYEGGKIEQMVVDHRQRQTGKSKYGLGRTGKVLSDIILLHFIKNYFQKPIHFFGRLGLIMMLIGVILVGCYFAPIRISEQSYCIVFLIVGVLLILFGIQTIALGIITEIQMRTYYESQNKRLYKIREID